MSSSARFHPTLHFSHAFPVDVSVPYLPAPHLEQLACPVSAVYWPMKQLLHSVAPDFDILPILHGSQTLLFDAPVIVPFDPGGQLLQLHHHHQQQY